MKTYIARGLVYGMSRGGGGGAYPIEILKSDTKEEILLEANKKLKEGLLDSGMGFECLLGAILEIEEIETIKVNNKEYSRSEYETVFIGELTNEQRGFLDEHLLTHYK